MFEMTAVKDIVDYMMWRNVTQITFGSDVYVPFEEYKRDIAKLRTRLAEIEEIHKKAEALFRKVEYRESDTSCSWRD